MAGTKKPNYGRVVNICTNTAQKELIGPALLAIAGAVRRGLPPGALRLGRLPGGHDPGRAAPGRVHGQRRRGLGQRQEDDRRRAPHRTTGKGSEKHKAAVTGDTVGDPLKDTAGPAINPMVKVMNMVSLLGLGLVLAYNVAGVRPDVAKFKPKHARSAPRLPNLPTNWHVGLIVVAPASWRRSGPCGAASTRRPRCERSSAAWTTRADRCK